VNGNATDVRPHLWGMRHSSTRGSSQCRVATQVLGDTCRPRVTEEKVDEALLAVGELAHQQASLPALLGPVHTM
jgi:hypothetical protein